MKFSPQKLYAIVKEMADGNLNQFQKKTGFPRQRLSKILRGEQVPGSNMLGKLAMISKRCPGYFFECSNSCRQKALDKSATKLALRKD